jgi:rare lipoprotein A (peptidoglycan hydrolase)
MRTAFFKHAFVATAMAASLGLAVSPACTSALADGSPSGGSASGGSSSSGSGAGGSASVGSSSSESAASGPSSGGAAPAQSPAHRRAIATWYGPGLYGHTTACGQKLTPKLVGLASRTLPCGTLVQISYHGHQLTAPVLDRGPFAHNGAMWDLTAGAARALEITETVRVATEIVGSLPNTPSLGEPALTTTPAPAGAGTDGPAEPTATASAATGGASAS